MEEGRLLCDNPIPFIMSKSQSVNIDDETDLEIANYLLNKKVMKILISEANNFSEDALKIYKTLGQVIEVDSDWKAIKKHINEIDILVIKLAFNFDESFLKKASCLKIIATSTTGLNHIKLPKNSNIEVVSLKNESKFLSEITPTAELTWGLILSLVRNIHSSIQSVKKKWERNKFIGNELKGRTLGIIGFGRIMRC